MRPILLPKGKAMSSPRVTVSHLPIGYKPVWRFTQLTVGLLSYGFSLSLMVRAHLGLNPWSVLYEGLEKIFPQVTFGLITAIVGVLVLLLWIPLWQRPGIGTVANIIFIAVGSDLGLSLLPISDSVIVRSLLLIGGILLNGFSIAFYVGARLGPGPRDGLMTGLSNRLNKSVRSVRVSIELAVLAGGWLLGGTVGVGTVAYALAVGAITQFFMSYLVVKSPEQLSAQQASGTARK